MFNCIISSAILTILFSSLGSDALYLSIAGGENIASNTSHWVTAKLWKEKGAVIKPPNGAGTSGADQELGPGLYVADDIMMWVIICKARPAKSFANNNYESNPGTVATICAIYAKDKPTWIAINKVEVPDSMVRYKGGKYKPPQLENARAKYIQSFGFDPQNTLVFNNFPGGNTGGQVVILDVFNPYLSASCFDSDEVRGDGSVPNGILPAGAYLPASNIHELTIFTHSYQLYDSTGIRASWNIKPINAMLVAQCLPPANIKDPIPAKDSGCVMQ
ncbi:hypothetical protein B0H11DRAFT_2345013 [Mycena galericulata]|nr:hypothetical protein B0H11DRAFT_2345013 [Mycena galericulata]